MSDKRKENKNPPKKIKRVVDYCQTPPFFDEGKSYFKVIYIIDSGNLINDVRMKYTETVVFNSFEDEEKNVLKFAQSRRLLKEKLESQIMATGANRLNAEFCAKKLLKSR